MSDKDVVTIDYLEDPARYADLLNVFIFSGEQQIRPEDVHKDNRSNSMPSANSKQKYIEVYRDIVREVNIRIQTVVIAVENQSAIHYAMPVRVMAGNSAKYHAQWRKIAYEHRQKKDIRDEEFLSGFSKNDKLTPVSTVVLYFGKEPWDGPRCLKDMMDIDALPPALQDFISDYPLHILEVRYFKNYELFQTDLKWVFGFLQRDQDADELYEYIKENGEAFSDMTPDAVELISLFSGSADLINELNDNKEGVSNMCKAIDDLKERSKNEGIEIGIIQGTIQTYKELGLSKDTAFTKFLNKFSMSPDDADTYMEMYWI